MQKLFLNEIGGLSFTKIGGMLYSIALGLSQPGVAPASWLPMLEMIKTVSLALGICGVRDAIGKKGGV